MLINIQALRAVAAFLVVFVHLAVFAQLLGLGPAGFEFGNAGVDIFFVISGFIMVVTTNRRRPTAQTFMLNRVVRIAPFYWLVTLVVFALALAEPALFQSTRADLSDLGRSLAFVPFRRANGMVQPVVFVGWTLNYEMAFYALFALGLMLRPRALGFGLTLAVLLAAVGLGALAQPKDTLGVFYSAPIVLEFALGMLIGASAGKLSAFRAPLAAVLVLDALMAALILAAPLLWPKVDRAFAFGLPGAVLVISAVHLEQTGRVLRVGWLRRLGDASFATYLTHFFVTQAVIKGAGAVHLTAMPAIALATVATFALVAAVGYATHSLVERPLHQGLSQWLRPGPKLTSVRAGESAPQT